MLTYLDPVRKGKKVLLNILVRGKRSFVHSQTRVRTHAHPTSHGVLHAYTLTTTHRKQLDKLARDMLDWKHNKAQGLRNGDTK